VTYRPEPLDTSHVQLPKALEELIELLARNAHENWARQRLSDGWTLGSRRDDGKKTHPCLIPYDELPESEKVYDRTTAMETIKAILALGYKIAAPSDSRR
jgi:hypothetical protein